MNNGVYKSGEGRRFIENAYRKILTSEIAESLTKKIVATRYGSTFVLEKSDVRKPPLILIHGTVSNSAAWLEVLPIFMQNYSVYCVDIPGEPGLSVSKRLQLNSDEPEKWLNCVLDALGLKKAAFLGVSLGGWYALNFAIHYPEKVTALSLISTGGIAKQKYRFIFKVLFFLMLGKRGRNLLNKEIFYKVDVPDVFLTFQEKVFKHFRPMTEPFPLFTDEQIRCLKMPVQYFGGDSDVLLNTDLAVQRLSSLLSDVDARLLKDTGHVIIDMFDETLQFLEHRTLGRKLEV